MCASHVFLFFFFFNDTATTEIYTLSLHDALPISRCSRYAVTASSLPSCQNSSGWPACASAERISGSGNPLGAQTPIVTVFAGLAGVLTAVAITPTTAAARARFRERAAGPPSNNGQRRVVAVALRKQRLPFVLDPGVGRELGLGADADHQRGGGAAALQQGQVDE